MLIYARIVMNSVSIGLGRGLQITRDLDIDETNLDGILGRNFEPGLFA